MDNRLKSTISVLKKLGLTDEEAEKAINLSLNMLKNKQLNDIPLSTNDDEVVEIKQAENVLNQFTDQKMTEIVEQALKEAFK